MSGTISRHGDEPEVELAVVTHHRHVQADAVGDRRQRVVAEHQRAGRVERELRAGDVRDHDVEERRDAAGGQPRDHARRTRGDRRRDELREVLHQRRGHRAVAVLGRAPSRSASARSRSRGSASFVGSGTTITETWLPTPLLRVGANRHRAPSPAAARRAARRASISQRRSAPVHIAITTSLTVSPNASLTVLTSASETEPKLKRRWGDIGPLSEVRGAVRAAGAPAARRPRRTQARDPCRRARERVDARHVPIPGTSARLGSMRGAMRSHLHRARRRADDAAAEHLDDRRRALGLPVAGRRRDLARLAASCRAGCP